MELLAPAGNPEKLEIALHYGADAVYLGLSDFSLRSPARGFDERSLIDGMLLARSSGRRAYLTLNILPHNRDLEALRQHLTGLSQHRPDAIIVSDPGVFEMVREVLPGTDLHISTQANVTNSASAKFWQRMGARRIILAREVSIDEIRQIRDAVDLEIEAFVHGSICIAYSGRCYISSFLSNRSANDGECANSCRWNYTLMEAKRPGEYMPVFEDDRGTYIMSSKDLCMIEHLDRLAEAGVTSIKIEGRAKGVNYVAGVVKVYREALDALANGAFRIDRRWMEELSMFSSRGYTTGMYFGPQPRGDYHHDQDRIDSRTHDFAGIVRETNGSELFLSPRTVLRPRQKIQFLTRGLEQDLFTIREVLDENGAVTEATKNEAPARLILDRDIPGNVRRLDLLRRPCQPEQTGHP